MQQVVYHISLSIVFSQSQNNLIQIRFYNGRISKVGATFSVQLGRVFGSTRSKSRWGDQSLCPTLSDLELSLVLLIIPKKVLLYHAPLSFIFLKCVCTLHTVQFLKYIQKKQKRGWMKLNIIITDLLLLIWMFLFPYVINDIRRWNETRKPT